VQVAAATRWPRAALFAVDGVEFDSTGVLQSSLFSSALRTRFSSPSEELSLSCFRDLVAGTMIATTSQVMVRAAALRQVGGSRTDLSVGSDYDLYLKIALLFDFTFINRALTRWRYLATSASGPREWRGLKWASDDVETLKALRTQVPSHLRPLITTALRVRLKSVAEEVYRYGRNGRRATALQLLLRLWAAHPQSRHLLVHLLALSTPRKLARSLRSFSR
jgi:hypothetical protein